MKILTILASFGAIITLAGSAQAAEFVTNGDFTQLPQGVGQIDSTTPATDWSTTGYNFTMTDATTGSKGVYGKLALWTQDNSGNNGWNGLAPSGNFAALDGDFSTGPLSQTINGLNVGQTYTLSFDYAFGQQTGYNGATIQSLSADFGGATVVSSADTLTNVANHGFSGWKTETLTVTATKQSEVLSFLSHGNLPVPPFALLSDVSLTGPAVPEPATWAMMIVGFVAMGAAARRRRHEMLAQA